MNSKSKECMPSSCIKYKHQCPNTDFFQNVADHIGNDDDHKEECESSGSDSNSEVSDKAKYS